MNKNEYTLLVHVEWTYRDVHQDSFHLNSCLQNKQHESHTFLSSVNIKCEILKALYNCIHIVAALWRVTCHKLGTWGPPWFEAIGPMGDQPYMSLTNESWAHFMKNITYYTSSYWCYICDQNIDELNVIET